MLSSISGYTTTCFHSAFRSVGHELLQRANFCLWLSCCQLPLVLLTFGNCRLTGCCIYSTSPTEAEWVSQSCLGDRIWGANQSPLSLLIISSLKTSIALLSLLWPIIPTIIVMPLGQGLLVQMPTKPKQVKTGQDGTCLFHREQLLLSSR